MLIATSNFRVLRRPLESALNTLVGVLIVAVVRASMLYFGVPATSQQIVFGIVLIAAIALTIDRSKMRIVK
ncbi:hypothetical protein [Mesorhizobium sp. LNHC229A00]|uniref:hypothetical protein n=1 Tax=Mesorhizobium sp. LNHC229A00 TaxID=1287240 RepID=UPI0003CE200D|nr:hypothetical protein [Mesorhizobium sp. LNHC229A00]ESY90413.1 hypothetical protein X741_27065 [Mesorhizobium sp. LNHC229A00]